jgi:hypothetical protein
MSERERDAYVCEHVMGKKVVLVKALEGYLHAPDATDFDSGKPEFVAVPCIETEGCTACLMGLIDEAEYVLNVVPHYTTSHAAAYEVEEKIREAGLHIDYVAHLCRICDVLGVQPGINLWHTIHASPDQRMLAAVQAKEGVE